RVDDVADDHPDGMARAAAQAGREQVRAVADLLGRGEDLGPQPVADVRVGTSDAGHRGRRDAGATRHLSNRGHALPPLCSRSNTIHPIWRPGYKAPPVSGPRQLPPSRAGEPAPERASHAPARRPDVIAQARWWPWPSSSIPPCPTPPTAYRPGMGTPSRLSTRSWASTARPPSVTVSML